MTKGNGGNLARTPVTPLIFMRSDMGFLMTTESGPRFNVSSERRVMTGEVYASNWPLVVSISFV